MNDTQPDPLTFPHCQKTHIQSSHYFYFSAIFLLNFKYFLPVGVIMHAPKKESCGREWWLETHKWFYGWEVNKNQERGQVVLAVHSGWGDLKEEGMKMCAGCRCMFLDPSGWPFSPSSPSGGEWKGTQEACVWIGVGGEVSTNPFLISLNANLLPLLSLFYVLQQEIKFLTLRKQRNDHRCIFKCSIVQNSCRTNPSLASSVDVHQIKSSRMQITRWHRVGGATNQSNRLLSATVTAFVTVAICLPSSIPSSGNSNNILTR